MQDDGGGGVVGTPIAILSRSTNFISTQKYGRSSGHDIAPPTDLFLKNRCRNLQRAERDALGEIYRGPSDVFGSATISIQDNNDVHEFMDAEDLIGKAGPVSRVVSVSDDTPCFDSFRHADGHALSDVSTVVTKAGSAVSIGFCMLRAHGYTTVASEDQVLRDSQHRKYFGIAELEAVLSRTEADAFRGVGFDSYSELADDAAKRQVVQVRPDEQLRRKERVKVLDLEEADNGGGNDLVDLSQVEDDDFNAYGNVVEGSLDLVASRIDKAFRKYRDSSLSLCLEALDEAGNKEHSEYWKNYVRTNYSEGESEPSQENSVHKMSMVIPDWFIRCPKHKWEDDAFCSSAVVPKAESDPVLQESIALIGGIARQKIDALGRKLAAGKEKISVQRQDLLLRVRNEAEKHLRQSFVNASGGEVLRDSSLDEKPGTGCKILRSVGDTARTSFAWEPESIIGTRFGVAPSCRRNVERQDLSKYAQLCPKTESSGKQATALELRSGKISVPGENDTFIDDNVGFLIKSIISRGNTTDGLLLSPGRDADFSMTDDCAELEDGNIDVDPISEAARSRIRTFVFGSTEERNSAGCFSQSAKVSGETSWPRSAPSCPAREYISIERKTDSASAWEQCGVDSDRKDKQQVADADNKREGNGSEKNVKNRDRIVVFNLRRLRAIDFF